jgi:hypothetical protein
MNYDRIKRLTKQLEEELELLRIREGSLKREENSVGREPLRKDSHSALYDWFAKRAGSGSQSSMSVGPQDGGGDEATRKRLEMGIAPQEKRAVTLHSADGPIQWNGQREWQASGRHSASPFEGQDRWGQITASGRHGSIGKPVVDTDSESRRGPTLPVSSNDVSHISDGERVETAESLRALAFAQIKQILADNRRQAARDPLSISDNRSG